jgi:hypothetical protein
MTPDLHISGGPEADLEGNRFRVEVSVGEPHNWFFETEGCPDKRQWSETYPDLD